MIKAPYQNRKVTPKQWAIEMLRMDVQLATDFYYERYRNEWDQMTEKEQAEVAKAIDKFDRRFLKILGSK
jgi:hypothetical protein